VDHFDPAPTAPADAESSPHRRPLLAAALPMVGHGVEIAVIATSPVIASWLANQFGLAVVGLYFVIAALVSYAASLVT